MKNSKSITELLGAVDTSYMTEAEKHTMLANAQRAEFIASSAVSAVAFIKAAFVSIKTNLNPRTLNHA